MTQYYYAYDPETDGYSSPFHADEDCHHLERSDGQTRAIDGDVVEEIDGEVCGSCTPSGDDSGEDSGDSDDESDVDEGGGE